MLYPMAAMVLLTLIIGLMAVTVRIASVRSGAVKARYYKLMQGQEVPEAVIKTGRNFNNQFEVPTLFYLACTLHLIVGAVTPLALGLAWAFVVLRVIHSWIHIGYNHVLHRLAAFFAGFACVLALWVNLLIQVR